MGRSTSGRHERVVALRAVAAAGFLAAAGTAGAPVFVAAQPATAAVDSAASRLPFFAGERLTYTVRVGKLGKIGRVAMSVDGPVDVRGIAALVLRFDFSARVGMVKAEDRTESWIDPRRMAALRFHKHERHPLTRHDEQVELWPERRAWESADGRSGASPTDAPLDELSFMYFVRTMPLDADTAVRLDRHFDAARNPVSVRVVGHRTVTTDAGAFRTVTVEMRVRDPRHYRGDGVIRLDLTDDHCRLPVRIESAMPLFGTTVMMLSGQNHPGTHHLARAG